MNVQKLILFQTLGLFFALFIASNGLSYEYATEFDTLDQDFWLVYDHGGHGESSYPQKYYLSSLGLGDSGESVLALPVEDTDHGPELITRGIAIGPGYKITASWRIKVHYANQYFAGAVSFNLVDYSGFYDPDKGDTIAPSSYYDEMSQRSVTITPVTVYYRNYFYGNHDKPIGGNTFGMCGAGGDCLVTTPIWDEFLTNKVEIDLGTYTARFWQNGSLVGEVKISRDIDPSKAPYLKIHFSPYGWWTGHKMELDWFRLQVQGSAGTTGGSTPATSSCGASFDLNTQILHIPCITFKGSSYWLDLKLVTIDPVLLDLQGIGQNNDPSLVNNQAAATLDLEANKLHIPRCTIGGSTYWIDLELVHSASTVRLGLKGVGQVTTSSNSEQGTGSDSEQGAHADSSNHGGTTGHGPIKTMELSTTGTHLVMFSPTADSSTSGNSPQYDLALEPWCVDKPGLCGNFVDLGTIDLNGDISIPSSGYLSDEAGYDDCIEVEPGHTYVNKNRDGSHTAFKITSHTKPTQCDHVITLEYLDLD